MKKLFLSMLCIVTVACALTCTAAAAPVWVDVDGVENGQLQFDATTGQICDAQFTITSANIPATINGTAVTSIGNDAFVFCYALSDVVLPNGLLTVGEKAFSCCYGLKSVTFSNSVTSIGGGAFSFCSNLASVTIPSQITAINGFTFARCESLKTVHLPDGLTAIHAAAFSGCSALQSITFPAGVNYIGKYAFSECDHLKQVTIPCTLPIVSDGAFAHCNALTTVTIPSCTTSIGYGAFYECPLTDIYYGGCQSQWRALDIDNTIDCNATVYTATMHYDCDQTESQQDATFDTPSAALAGEVYAAEDAALVPAFTGDPLYADTTTRLQFAQLIVQMVEQSTGEFIALDDSTFTDCTDTAALKAAAAGIVTGYEDGSFNPDATTTRQQIATMIFRAIAYINNVNNSDLAPLDGDLSAFTDGVNVAGYAQEAVATLAANGIMNGTSTTTLSPSNPCTIQQSIVLVYRLFQLV